MGLHGEVGAMFFYQGREGAEHSAEDEEVPHTNCGTHTHGALPLSLMEI